MVSNTDLKNVKINSVKEKILRIGPNGYQTSALSMNRRLEWIQP